MNIRSTVLFLALACLLGFSSAALAQADLALAKSVSDPTPNVGDTITFTVTLVNNGPNAATNVAVTDLLPAGLTFVSATPSQGSYTSGSGLWTVGSVAAGAAETLTIQATVVSPTPQTNTATISASDQMDPILINNTASATETPQQADLALVKTVSDPTPNVGDTITFTVTLVNNGPDAATNVSVTDLLPAGLNFVSATPSQGTYNSVSGAWSVGTVNPGAPQTLTIQAMVVSPAARTNTASVSNSDQFDPNTANNSASATETPQQADLGVTKAASTPTPTSGANFTWTVTVSNAGPSAATNVTVQDTLPAGVAFVSATPSQGAYNSGTGAWTIGTIASGGNATLVLTVTATAAPPATVTNTASVSNADQFDPNTGNNSASSSVTVTAVADLGLTKTVSDPTPNVGDTITFTVTLVNNGPNAATNVAVTDLLPAGLTFVSATPSQGSYTSGSGLWTVGSVANAATATLTIQATVVSPAPRTNTATITASDQFDPNTANNSASATETPQQADLALAKTVSNPTPNVGETITFTVTLVNNGPDAATNVSVADLLPAGLSFVSATPSQGTYNSVSGAWSVGTVNPGTPQTLTIQAMVVSPAARTNTASVSNSDQFDPNTANNTASATETPQQADLGVTKAASTPTPAGGASFTWTVTVSNAGPSAATNVIVQDTLPAGVAFVSATPSQGAYNNGTGVWTIGTIASGASATLVLTVTVTAAPPAILTNTASVSNADQFDPNTGNNSASSSVTVTVSTDLGLTKTVSNPTPNVGDTITFTVTLVNNGPNAATNVAVTDLLPAGLTFVSATPSQGSYTPGSGLWTVGSVANAATATLTIQATVVSPAARTNTASISASDQADPNAANNTASATETPQQANLGVTKAASTPSPASGASFTWTVTVSNAGPNAATNVTVQDTLPAGVTFVSATPSQGTYNSGTGVWTIGTIANGGSSTLVLTVTATAAPPATVTNTASVSNADQFDPTPANNSATSSVTIGAATDLGLTKTVGNPTPNVGDTITFTVTLQNLGPNGTTGITVTDLLPAGLTFVSATPSQGTYASGSGLWNVGSVANAATATLTIQATVASASAQTNTATITAAGAPDPSGGNNVASVTVTPQSADVALTKTVSPATPQSGVPFTWTVTVTNNGPNTATGVTVVDLLPSGVTLVTATPSQGTYAAASGLWTIGSVAIGSSVTLALTVTADLSTPVTNTATIDHVDQFDPSPATNSAASVAALAAAPVQTPTLSSFALLLLAFALMALGARRLRP